MPGSRNFVMPGIFALGDENFLSARADRFLLVCAETLGARLVDAERFLVHKVAGSSVGTRAAAHADISEFAAAAPPFQAAGIAELVEDLRVLPNVGEGLLAQISGDHRQVTAGIDFALVRNETYSGSRQAALGHGIEVGRVTAGMSDGLAGSLGFQGDSG